MRARAFGVALLVAVAGACSPAAEQPAPGAGTEWSRHELGEGQPRIDAIVAGGPGFIAAGGPPGTDGAAGSGIFTSTDAITWASVDPVRADRFLVDIVAGGPGFVALASREPGVWTSPDGLAWTMVEANEAFTDASPAALAAADGMLVAAGAADFWSSTDATTWRRVAAPGSSGRVNDVIAAGPGFVAVGSVPIASMESKGAVWTSADGMTWQRVPEDPVFDKAEVWSVAASGDTLVATGWSSDEAARIFFKPTAWQSTDGFTWTPATVNDEWVPVMDEGGAGTLEGAVMTKVARTPGGWVSGGIMFDARDQELYQDTAIWTSADGLTWQRVPPHPRFQGGTGGQLQFTPRTLHVADDRIVLSGLTSGPKSTIWISPPQPGGTEPSADPGASTPASPGP